MPFWINLLLFLATFQCAVSENQQAKLFNEIFSDYVKEVSPVGPGEDPLKIAFGLGAICVSNLSLHGVLDGTFWFRFLWQDKRLSYDEKKIEGMGPLRLSPSLIWIPDVVLMNRADSWNPILLDKEFNSKVLLYPDGELIWVPPAHVSVQCSGSGLNSKDVWADQTCTLKHSLFTMPMSQAKFNVYNNMSFVDLSDQYQTCNFLVANSTMEEKEDFRYELDDFFSSMETKIVLKRQRLINQKGIIRRDKRTPIKLSSYMQGSAKNLRQSLSFQLSALLGFLMWIQ